MAQTKIDYRVMGDYSIAKSFKGILRIAHVMEKVNGENDVFDNDVYYGAPSSLMNISGSSNGATQTYGHSSASEAFEGKVERYLSEQNYKNLKLPVTDSMGNYLNWNLGTEDSTIGSDIENNGISMETDYFYQQGFDEPISQPIVFPVLESKEIVIGLESKIHPSTTGGKKYLSSERLLELVNEDKSATLVISNLFDHSSENLDEIISKDENGTILQSKFPKYKFKKAKYNGKEAKYRTIIRDTKSEIEEYDAFVYSQENYNVKNFDYWHSTQDGEIEYNTFSNVKENSLIDAEVDVINLKEYVKNIIKKFMKSNVVEVPTGTVIHQFISPKKWYAHDDCGTGSVLNDVNCFIGHRPSMQLRNYDKTYKESSSTYEDSNRWISTTNQGACEKTNRLIFGDNVYKERNPEDEEEMNDSSFDGTKLSEIIPLYKRDYLLCDGSTYHIYLIEDNTKTLEIKRKHSTFNRFFELFYTIGYNYTIPVNESTKGLYNSPFSSIKTRYACKYENGRFRFLNPNGDIINSLNATTAYGTSIGTPKEISWTNEEMIKNLKDCETLYAIDVATMLAHKLLMEEDRKDTFDAGGKFNRDEAENWLKNQSIPKNYIFNSFVGDTNETFRKYWITPEAKEVLGIIDEASTVKDYVMTVYYRQNKDIESLENCSAVRIGREVNSFNSIIKYFVPSENGGEYVVCCVWQIPEIQYILDVLIAGSGERNKILPKIFDYKFRVPNLTESISPKFVGSTGFNWRDQKENDLETENTWTSSISVGTSPHRHAIFKSLLNGFSSNANLTKFKGEVLSSMSEIPSGSVNYHNRNESNFPYGTKNSGAGIHVSEYSGSYIWNELGMVEGLTYGDSGPGIESQQDISRSYILQRGNFPSTTHPNYYMADIGDGVTGITQTEVSVAYNLQSIKNSYSNTLFKMSGFKNVYMSNEKNNKEGLRWNAAQNKQNYQQPATRFPKTGDYRNYQWKYISGGYQYTERENPLIVFPSSDVSDLKVYFDWYGAEIAKWYSFDISEDPRFNNAEPNRCITGRPIEYTISGYTYNKNQFAAEGNTFNESYYFAPENVKMLPLIKL